MLQLLLHVRRGLLLQAWITSRSHLHVFTTKTKETQVLVHPRSTASPRDFRPPRTDTRRIQQLLDTRNDGPPVQTPGGHHPVITNRRNHHCFQHPASNRTHRTRGVKPFDLAFSAVRSHPKRPRPGPSRHQQIHHKNQATQRPPFDHRRRIAAEKAEQETRDKR